MGDHGFLHDFWVKLLWSQSCRVREVLFAIRENNGESLPEIVEQELSKVGWRMKGSRGCDMLFNHLREREKLKSASEMGRQARWHRCITSSVPSDMDRPSVKAQPKNYAATVAEKATPSLFTARKQEFSLWEEVLETFRGPKTWASPKPDKSPLVADMTCALMMVARSLVGLQALQNAWFALLADTGCLIATTMAGEEKCGMVISLSAFLVIVWKCISCSTVDGKKFWRLDVSEQPVERFLLEDLTKYQMHDVTLLTPAIVQSFKIEGGAPQTMFASSWRSLAPSRCRC